MHALHTHAAHNSMVCVMQREEKVRQQREREAQEKREKEQKLQSKRDESLEVGLPYSVMQRGCIHETCVRMVIQSSLQLLYA